MARTSIASVVMPRAIRVLACAVAPVLLWAQVARAAEHVVVVVFDGFRPDSINEVDTPNLYKMAHEGTFFAQHHPVYPSSTEVNGTALSTGGYPVHNGIMANNEYRPDIEPLRPIGTQDEPAVRKGDALSGGHYIMLPTVAEIARAAGLRTAVAGTKGVALLVDRASRTEDKSSSVVEGKTMPAELLSDAKNPVADFPERANERKSPNAAQDHWTTRFLIDHFWATGVPAYSLLWLSDPDYSQHGMGPGSDMARAALHNSDENLGNVLKALNEKGVRDKTDVLLVSDHGFSMIARNFDMEQELQKAGFHAHRKFKEAPVNDDVMVVGNSGSVCLYVIGHSRQTIAGIVDVLQRSDYAGVIFTKDPMPGTFTLSQALIDTPAAPDIMVAVRWTAEMGHGNLPGQLVSDSRKLGPGQGNHTSLSRFDMHNTLVANGPDFKQGFTDELPTGNADVAPTILHLLHLKSSSPVDGRVLAEALTSEAASTLAPLPPQEAEPRKELLKAEHAFPDGAWWQYLQITHMGPHEYLDEGNGAFDPSALKAQ